MHRLNFTFCILAICLCLLAKTNSCSANEKWTQFRGTDSSGTASESASPPVQWDLKRQIVWEAEVPGVGWSSPVYDAGRIWLTSAITTPATPEQIEKKKQGVEYARIKTVAASVELRVICVELASGKILHDLVMAKIDDPELINPMNSYASPTAAIANGRVIIHFGNYGTWCLDAASGEPLWKKTFVVDHSVGPGSSPIIFNDKVILVCDGIDQQFVVAVNLETGEEAWRTNRPPMRAPSGEQQKAYCTPTLINVNGQDQAIIPTAAMDRQLRSGFRRRTLASRSREWFFGNADGHVRIWAGHFRNRLRSIPIRRCRSNRLGRRDRNPYQVCVPETHPRCHRLSAVAAGSTQLLMTGLWCASTPKPAKCWNANGSAEIFRPHRCWPRVICIFPVAKESFR